MFPLSGQDGRDPDFTWCRGALGWKGSRPAAPGPFFFPQNSIRIAPMIAQAIVALAPSINVSFELRIAKA